MKLTLTQRLSLVFALLLLICCGASAWLQLRSNQMREKEVVQDLSRDLAQTIARDAQLVDGNGVDPDAAHRLFGRLMVVNPSVEVYLLDATGHITGHAAPAGRLKRNQVDLASIRKFLDGRPLPILGDDPRSIDGRKVFSAAPLQVNGMDMGYIYVVLMGEKHDQLAARDATSAVLNTALWSLALVALLCLLAGLSAFWLITKPLRRLTESVKGFDIDAAPMPVLPAPGVPYRNDDRDEIVVLDMAFRQMAERLGEQWRALTQQEQERRELIANISHDLRTPLSSLHGYLETLSLKDATLDSTDRRRYLGIALDQSGKVGRLAQMLFELARLEHGLVQPQREVFSLSDLTQDIFQKFELMAEARQIELKAVISPSLPPVFGDLGLIERAFTNLLDNALRHTPAGGTVELTLIGKADAIEVTVSDTGSGIPPELRDSLFQRPFSTGGTRRGGGLGLLIVYRILKLHDSEIKLVDLQGKGAAFRFLLIASNARTNLI